MGLNNLESDIENVKRTAQRAISHKRSASTLGYYKDDYIKYFSPFEKQFTTFTICYALRVLVCRLFIERFMKLFPAHTVQFVNLGAGLDTVSFWLLKNFKNVVCYETDFEAQLRLKSDVMYNNYSFKRLLPDMRLVDGLVVSDRYKMVPFDLTKIDEFDRLLKSGLSRDLPTVFLSEAVFMYIDPDYIDPVIKLLSEFSNKSSCFICWEYAILSSNETYVNFVIEKFKEYKIDLLSFKKYKVPEDHVQRHKSLGWDDSISVSMVEIWSWLDEEERERLMSIEKFNEMEELVMLLTTHMGSIATKNLENPKEFYEFFDKINNKYKETKELEKNKNQKLLQPSENFNRELFDEMYDHLFNGLNT